MASVIKARKAHAARVYAYQAKQRVAEGLTFGFGPVVERVIEFTNANHRALNLATGKYVTSATDRPLDFSAGGTDGLRAAGIDLFFSDEALSSVEGGARADENVVPQLDALDWRTLNTLSWVDREGPFEGDINMVDYRFFVDRLKLSDKADPLKSDETIRSTNLLRFVARDGTEGILQIGGLTDGSRSVKVRYKLLSQTSINGDVDNLSHDSLAERVEAAGGIVNSAERSRAFARLAADAAKAGEMELVSSSLQRIIDSATRNQAALDSARLLARRHLRRQGIEIARTITDNGMRDRALSELAR